jgi:SAM-dependent methyltransferase
VSVESGAGQVWEQGEVYDGYMGRWSLLVADVFVDWLGVDAGGSWLDVGCGTGALSSRIVERAQPSALACVDGSAPFVEAAHRRLGDAAEYRVADAAQLPFEDKSFDAVVSGLVLNFIPDPGAALDEQARVSRGAVGAYVWDYAEGMEMLKLFWEEASAVDPAAAALDEGLRFSISREETLREAFEAAGLGAVESRPIDVPTVFRDFDDLWKPFLGGQGPAGAFAVSLDDERRDELRERLRDRVPASDDGTIRLTARAWAVRGRAGA